VTQPGDRGRLISQAGIVALLAAYACFAWPGLYHLAAHVLDMHEHLTVHGLQVQRAWLYPAAVDGGIFVAGCILLTHPELRNRRQLWRELWFGMWTVAALSGAGLVADELSRLADRPWGWLPIPLVLAPVVIATWFLHMVVTMEEETDGTVQQRSEEGRGDQGTPGRAAGPGEARRAAVRGVEGEGRQGRGPGEPGVLEGEPAGDRRGEERRLVPQVALTAMDAGGLGSPVPGPPVHDDDSDMAAMTALTVSGSNGHGMSLRAQAERKALDYLAEHGRLPSVSVLTDMGPWKLGTARNALAPLRKEG
jgi:hypothetical protein